MESYLVTIETAFATFPFIAFIFTLPFLIHEYRKFGAIPFLKSVLCYSFVLYLLTAYLMVILPLPKISEVAKYTGSTMQLVPFKFLKDISLTTNLDISNMNSILNFLNASTVYTVLFNVLLTLPFGIYLRYLFEKKWYHALIYSFFLSLFFELTQLSGLYGIYPRPYRLFDVDDLIVNTTGGFLGFIITPIFVKILPTKKELNKKGYIKGKKVSIIRRSVALFIDLVLLLILTIALQIVLLNTDYDKYALILAIFLYYILFPLLNNTKTFGKVIVNTKIVGTNEKINILQLLFRNILLSYIVLFPYSWLMYIDNRYITATVIAFDILNFLTFFIRIDNSHRFLYEVITFTKNESTIEYKEEEEIENKNNKKKKDKTKEEAKEDNNKEE